MRLKVVCDWCGCEFERKKSQVKEKNYCCRNCLGKANGQRLRKHTIRTCDNCGRYFKSNNKHNNRNKHFFCSRECAYEFKVKKVYVSCDWCGKPIYKKRTDVSRNKHNFCDVNCYRDYITLACAGAPNQKINGKPIYRYLVEYKIKRKLKDNEEVHHIDGNHMNNAIGNLMAVTHSEHGKIHASKKRRDRYGRFIKSE